MVKNSHLIFVLLKNSNFFYNIQHSFIKEIHKFTLKYRQKIVIENFI